MEAKRIPSEREILDRVERMLQHLDRLLAAKEMDHETYRDAVLNIALWEESAMQALRG